MTLADRIRKVLDSTGMSQADLARLAGATNSAVTLWLNGSTHTLRAKNAILIENATGFRAEWLINGTPPDKNDAKNFVQIEGNEEYPAIKRVKFKLSAGASGFSIEYLNENAAPIVFHRTWYEKHGYRPEKMFAVKVANGSMENGLYDGDTVVVNTDSNKPKDGVVFAVNYEGEMVVKRLVRDAGQWWLSSDNPDQRRYPRKVCDEHVFIIGEVVLKQSARI